VTVFEGIIGHGPTLALLTGETKRPGHAYLFVGPAGVGKATVAQQFAAHLVCDDERGIARVLRHNHPDVTIIGPDGKMALGVEQARAVIAQSTLHPVESDRKVFIFDDASLMTDAAANALLKTLEEPSASTVMILVAESEHDLPITVASRCRTIRFGQVSVNEITTSLVERGIDAERAAETARIAGGSPGLALAFATEAEAAEFRIQWLSVPGRVTPEPGDAFLLAEEMLDVGGPLLTALRQQQEKEISELEAAGLDAPKAVVDRHERALQRAGSALTVSGLEMLASWYVDAIGAQHGAPLRNPDLSPSELARVRPEHAVRSAERTLDAVTQLKANQRPRLVLTSLFTALATDG
jgi:DNA polymerase-3 subunit delta'